MENGILSCLVYDMITDLDLSDFEQYDLINMLDLQIADEEREKDLDKLLEGKKS